MTNRHKVSLIAAALSIVVALAACRRSAEPPLRLGLKLAPKALGTSIDLQQHLTVEHDGRIADLDVGLEVDEREVNLVGLALGRRVLTLRYDGNKVEVWRDPRVPSQLRGEDVLEDLQLTLWPIESIREALPTGWQIEENGRRRILSANGALVTLISYSGDPRWSGEVVLRNELYHYKLTIVTAAQNASQ